MARIDIPKVRGKMAEKEITISDMAKRLRIDRNTLSSYIKAPEKMPYSIVSRMAEILCDSTDEATAIFFCD